MYPETMYNVFTCNRNGNFSQEIATNCQKDCLYIYVTFTIVDKLNGAILETTKHSCY